MKTQAGLKAALQPFVATFMNETLKEAVKEYWERQRKSGKPIVEILFGHSFLTDMLEAHFCDFERQIIQETTRYFFPNVEFHHLLYGQIQNERFKLIETWGAMSGYEQHKPNWSNDLAIIMSGEGEAFRIAVNCDLLLVDPDTGKKIVYIIVHTMYKGLFENASAKSAFKS